MVLENGGVELFKTLDVDGGRKGMDKKARFKKAVLLENLEALFHQKFPAFGDRSLIQYLSTEQNEQLDVAFADAIASGVTTKNAQSRMNCARHKIRVNNMKEALAKPLGSVMQLANMI